MRKVLTSLSPLIILLLVIILFLKFVTTPAKTDVYQSPNIPVVETESKQKKYIDQLTAKCYNQEEIEVACKG